MIPVTVNHVAVLTKGRPLSVIPTLVYYYTVTIDRPVQKQRYPEKGLLILLAFWLRGFHIWNHVLYFMIVPFASGKNIIPLIAHSY